MQSLKGCWRTPLLVLTAALIALVPFASLAEEAPNKTVIRQYDSTNSEQGPGPRPAFTPPETTPLKSPVLYPRTERFWALNTGPTYGQVQSQQAHDPDVVRTRVGSFVTRGPGLDIPGALRAPDKPVGAGHFIVQFKPDAFSGEQIQATLAEMTQLGAELIEWVPNNAYLVKLDRKAHDAVSSSSLVQYVGPYHPAYKIAPDLGMAPLPDPEKAASPVYSLNLKGWPGSSVAELTAEVTALGGTVTYAAEAETGAFVQADLHKNRILQLSRSESIRDIAENLPMVAYGEESSWNVIAGTYILSQKPSMYLVGVDGSGRYKKDSKGANNVWNNGTGDDTDWNGNRIEDNAAQIIADTDTGMAVDAGDFADTYNSSGFASSRCSPVASCPGTATTSVRQ